MDNILNQMIGAYENITVLDKKNSIKEVMQEIVLCGLSRAGFFKYAAFYGGTALRIFYGLDRFSEDLDFSLKVADPEFDLNDFLPLLEKEVKSYGVNFDIEEKIKSGDSNIKSAFLKGNTKEHLLIFYNEQIPSIPHNEIIKVKVEVDVNPPEFATFENKFRLLPIPYQVTLYDKSSLFSGKLHAVICRGWKSRIKGRDLYDYIFYLSNNTPFNLKHLEARLKQTDFIPSEKEITLDDVKKILCDRFRTIDFAQAKQDVLPFIKNVNALDIWSEEFFVAITENLRAE
ncbi:MAG: nucleotidyl transferase AbiEii/AbiGii toxin family protein [Lachnospiraceae bacterium]